MCCAAIAMKWDRLSQSCCAPGPIRRKKRFIYQRRGLQGVPGPLAPQVGRSQPAQFTIHDPGHLGQSGLVALPPVPQQDRHRDELRFFHAIVQTEIIGQKMCEAYRVLHAGSALYVQEADMQTLSRHRHIERTAGRAKNPRWTSYMTGLQEGRIALGAGGAVRRLENPPRGRIRGLAGIRARLPEPPGAASPAPGSLHVPRVLQAARLCRRRGHDGLHLRFGRGGPGRAGGHPAGPRHLSNTWARVLPRARSATAAN